MDEGEVGVGAEGRAVEKDEPDVDAELRLGGHVSMEMGVDCRCFIEGRDEPCHRCLLPAHPATPIAEASPSSLIDLPSVLAESISRRLLSN